MNPEPEQILVAASGMQFEKPVKGRVVDDTPLARGFGNVTDSSLIGQERNRIIQWEKSIANLKEKIKERKHQIELAKRRIKHYEKAAALR